MEVAVLFGRDLPAQPRHPPNRGPAVKVPQNTANSRQGPQYPPTVQGPSYILIEGKCLTTAAGTFKPKEVNSRAPATPRPESKDVAATPPYHEEFTAQRSSKAPSEPLGQGTDLGTGPHTLQVPKQEPLPSCDARQASKTEP